MSVPICRHCDEPILSTDRRAFGFGAPLHHECGVRSIAGSVAHQRKLCPCYGGTGEDDPALSVRANARLACIEWHAQNFAAK